MRPQRYETIMMPEGGLGSFFTSNLDEIDDNILMFGREGGINSMKDVADRMARMGREGDTFVVHASEKEVMVPREVAEKNPELVGQIKQAIAAEGADPEAYVVGSDQNSVNPYTGQREFFLKKLTRKIKKVFKKAAKVILPVAINFLAPGLGTIASAAIGAGIGGLVQGENLGQALKSAVVGGLTAGAISGVAGSFSEEGFMQGVKGGLPASYSGTGLNILPKASDFAIRGINYQGTAPGLLSPLKTGYAGTEGYAGQVAQAKLPPGFDKLSPAQQDRVMKYQELNKVTPEQAIKDVIGSGAANTGIMSTFGKYVLPAMAIGAATGAFDPIPAEEIDLSQTLGDAGEGLVQQTFADAEELVEQNPDKYRVGVYQRRAPVTMEDVLIPSRFATPQPVQMAARGGAMEFPRRTGQIQGPGTETSDDIPAMLSDGEFVMTAQAVRGAGGGDRQAGFRKMYDIMRAFEGGAVT